MSFLAAPPAAKPITIDPTRMHVAAQWKHGSPLVGARIDPSGKYVFAGAQDNAVVRWEVASGKATTFAGHTSWVRALAFAGSRVISADWAGRMIAWSIEGDGEPSWSVPAHRGWARAVAVSPDGQTLASCGNDHLVKLWSPADGRLLRALSGHDCHVYNVAFHPDGRSLVSADLKGSIKVWDVAKGAVVRQMDAKALYKYDPGFRADHGGIRSMAFDADGKHLAVCGITNVSNAFAGVGNPLFLLYDWASGKLKVQMKPKVAFQGTGWGVTFHPLGWVLGVGGGNGGAFWAWKLDSAVPFHTLTLPTNARDLSLHPDGRRVAIPFFDGVLRVYDLTEKKKA
jgi:WD40 repeat protein